VFLRGVETGYEVEIGPQNHMDGFPSVIVPVRRARQHREEGLKAMDFRN